MNTAHSRTPLTGGADLSRHAPNTPPAQAPAAASATMPAAVAAGAGAPVLLAQDLHHRYDTSSPTPALQGVDLSVHAGETVAIMGPSGCGKTTLLHVMAGILRPSDGDVRYRGRSISRDSDARRTRLRRSDFGFVFQDHQLLPELTALENVALPQMLGGAGRAAAFAGSARWLEAVGLGDYARRRPGQLSGGQAQRVAIARALAGSPGVVFADEPTGALDQASGHAVLGLLVGATARSGAGLILVTHDPAVAGACSRTIHMQDGRIIAEHRPQADHLTATAAVPGAAA